MTTTAQGAPTQFDLMLQSVFGNTQNPSALPQGSWSPSQQSPADVGEALRQGILGTVQNMMNAAVGEKYASGQLQRPQYQQQGFNWLPWALGGVVVLLLLRRKG